MKREYIRGLGDVTVMNVIEGRSNLQELYKRVKQGKSTQDCHRQPIGPFGTQKPNTARCANPTGMTTETISTPSGVVYQIS